MLRGSESALTASAHTMPPSCGGNLSDDYRNTDFQKSLHEVILSQPTRGMCEEQIHPMAIALRNQKTSKMDCTLKNDNYHPEWEY